MTFKATLRSVANRGAPPVPFLNAIVTWARTAPAEMFAPQPAPKRPLTDRDIYAHVKNELGPWEGLSHRCAVMLEVLRVLGGFESSWNWNEGRDITNKTSDKPWTTEAGLWQVSMNACVFGEDLRALVLAKIGTNNYELGGDRFQVEMKRDHEFAIEFIVRLLRHTVDHNGPATRHEINPYLRRDAVAEFQALLAA